MPIVKIHVCSRNTIHTNPLVWQHNGVANVAWITISDPLRLYDGSDVHGILPKIVSDSGGEVVKHKLGLRFDDAEPSDVGWCIATQFAEGHAKEIIEFVRKVHYSCVEGNGNTLLVINCFAGKSRSAAVGKVIGSRLGAGVSFFSDGVSPNAWVMKVLNREWNKPNV